MAKREVHSDASLTVTVKGYNGTIMKPEIILEKFGLQ
jgi:hypothetical protein